MFKKLKNDNDGFTIIEVLIVLAIAGLIMLVVFLAVPALQRNSRNTSRNNDAARISALVTECLSNRNGVVDECDDTDGGDIGFAADDFSIIDEVEVGHDDATSFAVGADDEGTTAVISFGTECSPGGAEKATSTNSRKFTVAFQIESGSGDLIDRCVGSE